MIPVIMEIDADFLSLSEIPEIILKCWTEPNASRLTHSALTWTHKFSCKITGKNCEIPKLEKHWENLDKTLKDYWKFNWKINIGKRDTLANTGKSFHSFPRLVFYL